MVSNPISVDLWTVSTPEIQVEAYAADSSGVKVGGEGRIIVSERTVSGSLVISGRSQEPLVLIVESEVSQSVVGSLDEIRINQQNGEQVFFRFNSYVSTNDLGMNRTATGSTQQWGVSTRTKFSAPCIIEFAQEWYRLNLRRETGEDNYRISMVINEVP